ncbi:MAG: hypothetical protein IJK88_02630 [Clostridia bacterium]|nr:hypothetical protein [Clostridia bacterium]
MKRIITLFFAVLLFIACVPTPEEEVVLSKTEGRLEAAITETTPVPAYQTEEVVLQPNGTDSDAPKQNDPQPTDEPRGTLRTALGAPEHCSDSTEGKVYGGTLKVEIDADVEIPNVSEVPVYTVRDRVFTPEECEHIAKVLLGDGPYYSYNRELAEQTAAKHRIEYLMKRLHEFDSRAYGDGFSYDEGYRFSMENQLSSAQKHYAELTQPGPSQPWTGSFAEKRVVLSDALNRYLAIGDEMILLYDEFSSAPDTFGAHASETAGETEAMRVAEALFSEMVTERFAASIVQSDNEWLIKNNGLSPDAYPAQEYEVMMVRTEAGIPCYPYSAFHGSDTAQQAAGFTQDYDDPVIPEHCDVLVRDGKVASIIWYNAFEVTGTENENVALLPFDDILNIFKRQIFRSIYLDPAESGQPEKVENMVVERIVLSYMRVKKKDAQNEQYLLPVWDFMGYSYDARHEGTDLSGTKSWFSGQSLLTVNAIDGSIVDRNVGY